MSGATERPGHTPMRDDHDDGRQDGSKLRTRRNALAGGAGALLGIGGVVSLATTPAAAVDTAEFAAEDTTASVPYDTDPAPQLTATGPWRYDRTPDANEVMLAVLSEEQLLASVEQDTDGPSDSGTYELGGVLTDLRAFEADAFSPPQDGTREVPVSVEVRLEVRDARGQVLVSASASDDLTVTVNDSGVSVRAAIGGSASVAFGENKTA